jgi:hypothetical protein
MMIGAHKHSANGRTAGAARPRCRAVGLLSTTALAAVVLLGTTGGGSAQSLVDAMVMSYQDNPTLRAARAALRAVDDGVPEAKSFFLPSLTASGSIGKNVTVNQARNGIGTTNIETTPRRHRAGEERRPGATCAPAVDRADGVVGHDPRLR